MIGAAQAAGVLNGPADPESQVQPGRHDRPGGADLALEGDPVKIGHHPGAAQRRAEGRGHVAELRERLPAAHSVPAADDAGRLGQRDRRRIGRQHFQHLGIGHHIRTRERRSDRPCPRDARVRRDTADAWHQSRHHRPAYRHMLGEPAVVAFGHDLAGADGDGVGYQLPSESRGEPRGEVAPVRGGGHNDQIAVDRTAASCAAVEPGGQGRGPCRRRELARLPQGDLGRGGQAGRGTGDAVADEQYPPARLRGHLVRTRRQHSAAHNNDTERRTG